MTPGQFSVTPLPAGSRLLLPKFCGVNSSYSSASKDCSHLPRPAKKAMEQEFPVIPVWDR